MADMLSSLGFCAAYHLVARWWRHPFGISMMIYQVLMTVVMGLTAYRYIAVTWFHAGPAPMWFEMLRTGVFAIVPVTLVWRTWVLVKVRRREPSRQYDT